jgi:hypothetical protein
MHELKHLESQTKPKPKPAERGANPAAAELVVHLELAAAPELYLGLPTLSPRR